MTLMFEIDRVRAFPIQQNAGELYDAEAGQKTVEDQGYVPIPVARGD